MTASKKSPTFLKFTVVGDGYVGKTCMLIVYAKNEYPKRYIPTVFDNYCATVKLDGEEYEVKLWDTAGQEDYERLLSLSFPDTTCFLICYSISSQPSYDNVRTRWYPQVNHHMPHTPIILVGTKQDLREDEDPNKPTLTEKDGHKMKKLIKAVEYLECSALRRTGIDEIIHAAIRHSRVKPVRRQRTCTML